MIALEQLCIGKINIRLVSSKFFNFLAGTYTTKWENTFSKQQCNSKCIKYSYDLVTIKYAYFKVRMCLFLNWVMPIISLV